MFEERLNRVLRLLEGIHGIADYILTHGETEIQHDGRLLTLLETARMNSLSLNPEKYSSSLQTVNSWTQTNPRRPQTRSRESESHS